MANSPDKPGSPQQSASYFPIELTELDLDNVVGGVAHSVHVRPDGLANVIGGASSANLANAGFQGREITIMCCW
jgi:hypothetical protein